MTSPSVYLNGASAAEKFGLIKSSIDEMADDIFSDAGSRDDARSTIHYGGSRAVTRNFSRSSHRSASYMASHRHKMSSELTAKAESKFMALMEFMASASREAGSLKEYWSKILHEREMWIREREELCEQITEYSQEIEQVRSHRGKHDHDLVESRKTVAKLEIDLAAAVLSVSTEKKKVAEHERELERVREQLHERDETITRTKTEYEKTRSELETTEINLKTVLGERDSLKDDAERHEKEVTKVTRERNEISSKLVEITTRHESSRKEILSLTDKVRIYELEREEWLLECDRLKDDGRRCRSRAEEASKELFEMTEKYERISREFTKVKETIKTIESERDEYRHTIEHLRREIKALIIARDDAEEKCSDATLKHEHVKREVVTVKERLREVEIERTEITEKYESVREQHRVLIIERDELKDEIHHCHRKIEDGRREIISWTEKYKRIEHSLFTTQTEVSTLNERVRHIERERDDARHKCGDLDTELIDVKQQIVSLSAQIKLTIEARDKCKKELEKCRHEYEEICETVTTHRDSSSELEIEIDNLRDMLREAREQKEIAIAARSSADHDRDTWCSKYEAKCREMERLEESLSQRYRHAHSHNSGNDVTTYTRRMVSREDSSNHHSHAD